jgi:hypothetical protein
MNAGLSRRSFCRVLPERFVADRWAGDEGTKTKPGRSWRAPGASVQYGAIDIRFDQTVLSYPNSDSTDQTIPE